MRRRTCRSVEREGGREGEGGKESKGNIILVEWVEREGGGFVKVEEGSWGEGGRRERKTIIHVNRAEYHHREPICVSCWS